MKRALRVAGLALGAALAARAAVPAPQPTRAPRSRSFADVRDRYVKAFFRRFPVVATTVGAEALDRSLAKLDGTLRDFTPAELRAERQEWESFQFELKSVDRGKLPPAERVDADLAAAQLAFLVSNLARVHHERALDVYVGEPLRGVETLLHGDGTALSVAAAQHLQERLAATPAYLAVALTNLRRGASAGSIPDRRLIRSSCDAAGVTAEFLEKDVADSVRRAPAEAAAPVLAALPGAAAAYRDFQKGLLALYFQKDGAGLKPEFDRDRFAAGEAGYAWALKNNLRVARAPRELHLLGKQAVGEALVRLTALARTVAERNGWPDASASAVLARLSEGTQRAEEEKLSWFHESLRGILEQGRAASAAQAARAAYPAAHQRLTGRGALSPERWLLPGGSADSASMWADAMALDGWALHVEEHASAPREPALLSPDDALFAVRSRLFHAALLVVDTGIHCGFMGFDEAVAVLSRNVWLVKGPISTEVSANPSPEERAAVEAARRTVALCARWPTRAVAGFLGNADILELEQKVRELEGAAFDERRFHEELLAEGPIPVGFFRDAFLERVRARTPSAQR